MTGEITLQYVADQVNALRSMANGVARLLDRAEVRELLMEGPASRVPDHFVGEMAAFGKKLHEATDLLSQHVRINRLEEALKQAGIQLPTFP